MSALDPRPPAVLTLFGTRPEIIKLAPVIHALEAIPGLRAVNVSSGQHTDLLRPFIRQFGIRVDRDLSVMEPSQTLNRLCARVLELVDGVLVQERPDLVLVQGDTTTAMAGALAAFHRKIPVGHVEAGLRSGDPSSPYPEEVNRRLISRLARLHFAATDRNRETLLHEGTPGDEIFVTGNPVVDALQGILRDSSPSPAIAEIVRATEGSRRIVLTTHRRESFGDKMRANLRVLRRFVEAHDDVAVVFPVHPNPEVRAAVVDALGEHSRVRLIPPVDYRDFVHLLAGAWLIVSDSGGVQEEAPTLRKPLLVLRDNTERPEAIESGVAKLVGGDPERLALMLEDAHRDGAWTERMVDVRNPFGDGNAGHRIAAHVARFVSSAAAV